MNTGEPALAGMGQQIAQEMSAPSRLAAAARGSRGSTALLELADAQLDGAARVSLSHYK